MTEPRKIIVSSLQYLAILLAIDLILSFPLSFLYGGVEWSRFMGLLGDLTILESVGFFFMGAAWGLYDVAETRPCDGEKDTITRIPYRGGWFLTRIARRRNTTEREGPERMKRALTSILCGFLLFIATVVIAKIAGF